MDQLILAVGYSLVTSLKKSLIGLTRVMHLPLVHDRPGHADHPVKTV